MYTHTHTAVFKVIDLHHQVLLFLHFRADMNPNTTLNSKGSVKSTMRQTRQIGLNILEIKEAICNFQGFFFCL